MTDLVLCVGDLHHGKETKSFNTSKSALAFEKAVKETENIGLDVGADTLHIAGLGDLIDADSIYPTQPHHTDSDARYARKQVQQLVEITRNIFGGVKLKIKFKGVRGNHGRVGKYTHEANNWDLQYYDSLKWACESLDHVDIESSEEFYDIMTVQDKDFLLYHGYSIRSYHGIPWYGIEKRIQNWYNGLPEDFDHVLLGHFHTQATHNWNNVKIFLNGTAVTDDMWALETLGKKSCSEWWLIAMEDGEIIWTKDIKLDDI